MIFTSLGLLLVSLGLLIAGIAKSSVALLMASLLCTIVAGVVLATVLPATRRLSAAIAPGGTHLATPNGQPVVLYMQQAPGPGLAGPVPMATDHPAASSASNGAPIVGYDDMTAQQITKLVTSGALSVEQIGAIREYERTHAGRRTVLAKLS